MKHPERDTKYLKHILESINMIEEYLTGVSEIDFLQ